MEQMEQVSPIGLPEDTQRLLSRARAPFERIFVPVDYGADGHRAVGVALELQRVYGSTVCLFHVQDEEGSEEFLAGVGAPVDADGASEAIGRLRRFVDNIAPGAASRVEARARVGGDAETAKLVLDEAAEWRATLIVVTATTHRALLRTVAERVVRKTPVAVLVLHGDPD